ncbi:MAG: alpha/beta hydrolase-fold protein [Comamonadaceae bacterium]|nr:alpha/beta hydrolase-fold protein [Comamonadaceae bacterium]
MRTLLHRAIPSRQAATLLVLLPGAYDTPEDLERQGFVHAVQAAGLAADVLLADAHTDYYTGQQIVPSLHTEVLTPARDAEYAQVWLAGISLGGYGSLLYAQAHPGMVNGLFLMAPFMGRRDLPAAIARAGGLHAWTGTLETADQQDLALWRWLRGRAAAPCAPRHVPPIWLGYGEADRFAASSRLLAAALPAAQVFTTPGGHQWAPWLRLWARFLGVAPWQGLAGAKAASSGAGCSGPGSADPDRSPAAQSSRSSG